ncbi:MAG: response regulator [Planctomycetota bacterium]
MLFDAITPGLLDQAIRAYLELAWVGGYHGRVKVPDYTQIPREDLPGRIRQDFRDESHNHQGHKDLHVQRYTLRLGNDRYPNMKLVIQEFMYPGQYFLAVDSHDQLPVSPGMPGFEEWQKLRDHNAWLKQRIESRWKFLGVPTLSSVTRTIQARQTTARLERPRRVLVVDDDDDIATATIEVLQQKGLVVVRACDGRQALDMVRNVRPDLIIMDYMMPGENGGEICKTLKQWKDCCGIPVLLATTTPIELIGRHTADGFLVKPFHRQVLLQMVMHLLGEKPSESARQPTAETAKSGD